MRAKSREFAAELSGLLNNTVCHGISLNSVITSNPTRAVVGYKITKNNFSDMTGIPVTTGSRPARVFLGLSMRLSPDHERKYLMVNSSVMIVAVTKDVENDDNILFHYDYERDKGDGYPEAHLQVHASSQQWNSLRRLDGEQRALDKLHLPVGGRRFRPTLEDVIDFLVTENFVHKHEQCDQTLADRREEFQRKQLRAAVRRNPQPAVDELREQGYTVKEPKQ